MSIEEQHASLHHHHTPAPMEPMEPMVYQKKSQAKLAFLVFTPLEWFGLAEFYGGNRARGMARLLVAIVLVVVSVLAYLSEESEVYQYCFLFMSSVIPFILLLWISNMGVYYWVLVSRQGGGLPGMNPDEFAPSHQHFNGRLLQVVMLIPAIIISVLLIVRNQRLQPGKCVPTKDYDSFESLIAAHPIDKYLQTEDNTLIGNEVALLKDGRILKVHPPYSDHTGVGVTKLFCTMSKEVKSFVPEFQLQGSYGGGSSYTIQTLAKGERMYEWLDQNRSEADIKAFVKSMCTNLHYMAKEQLMHADLHLKQIYFDTATKEVSIIDWDNSTRLSILDLNSQFQKRQASGSYWMVNVLQALSTPIPVPDDLLWIFIPKKIRNISADKIEAFRKGFENITGTTTDVIIQLVVMFALTEDPTIATWDWSTFKSQAANWKKLANSGAGVANNP